MHMPLSYWVKLAGLARLQLQGLRITGRLLSPACYELQRNRGQSTTTRSHEFGETS
jgi:hypothetical protein